MPFWTMVISLLQRVLDNSFPLDLLHYLLGLPFPGIGKPLNKLASFILLAAKKMMTLHWLSPTPSSQVQLLKVILEICRLEYMTASMVDAATQFNRIWDAADSSEFGSPPGLD